MSENKPSLGEGTVRGIDLVQKLAGIERTVENLGYLTARLMKFGLGADVSMFNMGWDEKVEKVVSDVHGVGLLLKIEELALTEGWNNCMRNGALRALKLVRDV